MIKDITIGQFFPGNSVIHKLDPRIKLVLTFVYIVIVFLCKNFAVHDPHSSLVNHAGMLTSFER